MRRSGYEEKLFPRSLLHVFWIWSSHIEVDMWFHVSKMIITTEPILMEACRGLLKCSYLQSKHMSSIHQHSNLMQSNNAAHAVTIPEYNHNNAQPSFWDWHALRHLHSHTNYKECVSSVYPSLLFSPSHPSSLQRWSMRKGLGGWWLSLNDPVYFEKALISASALLNANKGASKSILARSCAAWLMLQTTLFFIPVNKYFMILLSCHITSLSLSSGIRLLLDKSV